MSDPNEAPQSAVRRPTRRWEVAETLRTTLGRQEIEATLKSKRDRFCTDVRILRVFLEYQSADAGTPKTWNLCRLTRERHTQLPSDDDPRHTIVAKDGITDDTWRALMTHCQSKEASDLISAYHVARYPPLVREDWDEAPELASRYEKWRSIAIMEDKKS